MLLEDSKFSPNSSRAGALDYSQSYDSRKVS